MIHNRITIGRIDAHLRLAKLYFLFEAKEDLVVTAGILYFFLINYLSVCAGALRTLMILLLIFKTDYSLEVLLIVLHAQILVLCLGRLNRAHGSIPPFILLYFLC